MLHAIHYSSQMTSTILIDLTEHESIFTNCSWATIARTHTNVTEHSRFRKGLFNLFTIILEWWVSHSHNINFCDLENFRHSEKAYSIIVLIPVWDLSLVPPKREFRVAPAEKVVQNQGDAHKARQQAAGWTRIRRKIRYLSRTQLSLVSDYY